MLGIGGGELALILLFGFLIFGPDRLPSMGRTIGRALRQFRQAQDQMNKVVQTEIMDPLHAAADGPVKKQGPKKKVSGKPGADKPETFAEKKARLAAEAQAASGKPAQDTADTEAQAATPQKKKSGTSETFAEKKARLDAEKKAQEEKKTSSSSTASKPAAKKSTGSAAKLYGVDKERIAEARAAAAAEKEKEVQADA